MARTLTKEKPPKQKFLEGLDTIFSTPAASEEHGFDTEHFEEAPVDIITFAREYRRKPLWPIQEGFVEEIMGTDPTLISQARIGGCAFWGKGSGKDMTICDLQTYLAYWLMCLRNPQEYLREVLGCSVADGDAIDFGNVSINERQAKNVFFKKFKAAVRTTVDPATGQNWFGARGLDLREGYDIQKVEIQFPHEITAHSLNSETHTGEGLNLLFVTMDEFGSFNVDNAFTLLDSLESSCRSRFKRVGKICVISYKYKENDPMHILYNRWKDDPDYFCSQAATFDVNVHIKKSDFAKAYEKDPGKARRMYECAEVKDEGGYITRKYMLKKLFDEERRNPVKGDLISVLADHLVSLQFKDWFKPIPGRLYAVAFDLAKGKVAKSEGGGDAAGFTMCHPEMMKPVIDKRVKKELEGLGITIPEEEQHDKKGIIFDLMLQLVAPVGSEIPISECRKFVFRLRKMGFNISAVSYDGWQSLESVQELKNAGIDAEVLSVDKDNTPYDFIFKELLYQQLLRGYPHPIALREAEELLVNDKGKIDHPEKSWRRWIDEGEITDKGSKDVTDSMAASGYNGWQKISLFSGTGFGNWDDDDDD